MTEMSLEQEIAERFRRDTANHEMTVLHDAGVYRHLRFQQPGRSGYWYDIVTWPGCLALRGDIDGAYVFNRTADMFEFFRGNGNDHGINPGYWAEKLPDHGKSVKEYSDKTLRETLEPHLAEYEHAYPEHAAKYTADKAVWDATPYGRRWPLGTVHEPIKPQIPADVRQIIVGYDDDGLLSDESEARRMLRELEQAGVVSDTWEWELSDWDWTFLWACHAIVAGIAHYDAAKPAAERPAPTPGTVTVALAGVSS